MKGSSTLQQEATSNQEDHRNLSSDFEATANKSFREFSAPTTDNIRTGPAAEIDGNFELKPGLINMVVTSKNSHSKITRIKNYFQNIFQKL